MKDSVLTIVENEPIARDVRRMTLRGNTDPVWPGQFVNLRLPGFYLRRPISICDAREDRLTLIYKIVGEGTAAMSALSAGDTLQVLIGLGNGYDLSLAGDQPLLLGGGVGVPPLYLLARKLRDAGKDVQVVLGFNAADDVFYPDAFAALGCRVAVTTADGSFGRKGFVTDALPEAYSYFYTCGPLPMLRAVKEYAIRENLPCYVSMEERMACGIGACLACVCRTTETDAHSNVRNRRICKDGPVFEAREVEL